jgi:hypothetical protein
MKPLTKKRIIIWTSIAVILGVGGYFGYVKVLKPYLQRIKGEKDGEKPSESLTSTTSTTTTTPPTTPPTSGGNSPTSAESFRQARQKAWDAKILAFSFQGKIYSTNTGQIVPNPFKTEQQLIDFQNWVVYTKKDSSIGKVDGIWGVKSAIALIKYFNDYGNYLRNK